MPPLPLRLTPFVASMLLLVTAASPLAAAGQTRNVLLVTIDGLRWQEVFRGADDAYINTEFGGVPENALQTTRDVAAGATAEERRERLMPFLWGTVAKHGQVFGNRDRGSRMRVGNDQWFSYPGYNELLCGFADPLITSNTPVPNRNVTVLEWLNGREPWAGRVAAVTTWHVFPAILNVGRSRFPHWVSTQNPALAARSAHFADIDRWMRDIPIKARDEHYDAFAFRAALEMIGVVRPRVLYLALGEPDTDAHRRRYDAYLQSITRADRFLAELWAQLQALDEYRGQTSLLITTDHGRGQTPQDWMNHNRKTPHSDETWLAVLGPDTPPRGERSETPEILSAQVAATLAALLGTDFPAAEPRAAPPIGDVLAARP